MQLITDRTEADVLLGTQKGRYGCSDLNRVEGAVAALLPRLLPLDIRLLLQTKTDWAFCDAFSAENWPVKSQMRRYLLNVQSLCAALGLQPELPESMEQLSFTGANQIEQALLLAERHIAAVQNTFRYSGDVFAGEE